MALCLPSTYSPRETLAGSRPAGATVRHERNDVWTGDGLVVLRDSAALIPFPALAARSHVRCSLGAAPRRSGGGALAPGPSASPVEDRPARPCVAAPALYVPTRPAVG
jgi:hypothetical protein